MISRPPTPTGTSLGLMDCSAEVSVERTEVERVGAQCRAHLCWIRQSFIWSIGSLGLDPLLIICFPTWSPIALSSSSLDKVFFYTLACSLSSCNAKEWCPALLQYLCLVSLLVASFLHVGFGGALPTPRIALFVRPSVSNEIPGRGSGVGGLGSGQTA